MWETSATVGRPLEYTCPKKREHYVETGDWRCTRSPLFYVLNTLVVLYVGSGHGYITITLFLVHDVIMACLRFRYEHLEIAEPSCGRDNSVNRG